jgi:hypothetical protein
MITKANVYMTWLLSRHIAPVYVVAFPTSFMPSFRIDPDYLNIYKSADNKQS